MALMYFPPGQPDLNLSIYNLHLLWITNSVLPSNLSPLHHNHQPKPKPLMEGNIIQGGGSTFKTSQQQRHCWRVVKLATRWVWLKTADMNCSFNLRWYLDIHFLLLLPITAPDFPPCSCVSPSASHQSVLTCVTPGNHKRAVCTQTDRGHMVKASACGHCKA